jgi:hypothetical protein
LPLCAAGDADLNEVFNAKIAGQSANARAGELAREFSLPAGTGSDAHDAPGVGDAYLDMPDFNDPASFLAALADARVTGEYRDHAKARMCWSRVPQGRIASGPGCHKAGLICSWVPQGH